MPCNLRGLNLYDHEIRHVGPLSDFDYWPRRGGPPIAQYQTRGQIHQKIVFGAEPFFGVFFF